MRALNDHELNSVSGGCFGLFSNLLGGLFGGGQAAGQAAGVTAGPMAGANPQAARANMIPAANYASSPAAARQAGGMPSALSAGVQQVEQGISNFLQNPVCGVVSLIGSGIQDAVNFFTRLI